MKVSVSGAAVRTLPPCVVTIQMSGEERGAFAALLGALSQRKAQEIANSPLTKSSGQPDFSSSDFAWIAPLYRALDESA